MKRLLLFTFMLFINYCSAWAGNYNVSTNSDFGAGSLRQAILDANASGSNSNIDISLPPSNTILLFSSLPAITVNISIRFISNPVTINGNNTITGPLFTYTNTGNLNFTYLSGRSSLKTINFPTNYYYVTNTNSSGDGSLKKAIHYAYLTDQLDYIYFNIPGIAPHTILQPTSNLEFSSYPIVIDGNSQPANGYSGINPKIILEGGTVGSSGGTFEIYGLAFNNCNVTLAGDIYGTYTLSSVKVGLPSNENIFYNNSTLNINNAKNISVRNNFFGIDKDGNVFPNQLSLIIEFSKNISIDQNKFASTTGMQYAIYAREDSNMTITSNYIGTTIDGSASSGQPIAVDIRTSKNVSFGSSTLNKGNVLNGRMNAKGYSTIDLLKIVNNKIGLNVSGNAALEEGEIDLLGYVQLGGNNTNEGNYIKESIRITILSNRTSIYGNKIGVLSNGSVISPRSGTISIEYLADSVEIGKILPGYGNTIAGLNSAITADTANHISIRGNSIFGSTVKCYSHTRSFNKSIPIITALQSNSVMGKSISNGIIDIYYNHTDNCVPNGKTYLASVTSDANGNWSYTNGTDFNAANGLVITCTDQNGNTSEFSKSLFANAGNDKSICANSSTNLQASGGTIYLWTPSSGLNDPTIPNPIANPTINSTYILAVTNAIGCQSNDTLTITVHDNPTVDAGADKVICSNTSTTIGVSPSLNINYSWTPTNDLSDATISNPIANPFSDATYTLTATDQNNCSASDQVIITVLQAPIANAGADESGCLNSQITIGSSPEAGNSYSWSPSTDLSDATIANPSALLNSITEYVVTVTAPNQCFEKDTILLTINACTGIKNIPTSKIQEVKIYPNPSQNTIWIESTESTDYQYELTDLIGNIVHSGFYSSTLTISIHTIPVGIYVLKLRNIESGSVEEYKITKN